MSNSKTISEYSKIVAKCRAVFESKNKDYGSSWRIMRPSSLTDQIFIKAKRIKTIEQKKNQKIGDAIHDEYIGICNYCIMAIFQSEKGDVKEKGNESINDLLEVYDTIFLTVKDLMLNKNHDYGEAWREMRISSITDLILAKLLRIKQIEDNEGIVTSSEGIIPNYHDIINYAIFALIKISHK